MSLIQILNVIVPIFSLVALGYFACKRGLVNNGAVEALSSYVYYFALPALLILKLSQTEASSFADLNLVLGYALPMVLVAAAIAVFARRTDPAKRSALILTTIFGNVAFIGIPFSTLAFGESATAPIAITLALTVLLALFLSEEGGKGLSPKRLFTNPVIISTIIGVVLSVLHFGLPKVIASTFELLAVTAGPTALFTLGIFLVGKTLKRGDRATITLITTAKLLVLPALTFVSLKFIFPVEPIKFVVAVSQAAMPMAATNFVLVQKLGVDPEMAGDAILASTIVSTITLSLLLIILA